MILTTQGFGHFTNGINNQDFGIESGKMLLVLDGCSAAKYAEAGTRLFGQLFSRKEEWDNLDKFEDNVKSVFDDIIRMAEKYYPDQNSLERDFIMENLLFTIIACFEQENQYVVKLFGDGYIATQNIKGAVSYVKFSYGKCPPYYAYKYCTLPNLDFSEYEFKTFCCKKDEFQKVAIATDGIQPIVLNNEKDFDKGFATGNIGLMELVVKGGRTGFQDDVTFGMFVEGGKQNGNIQ